VGEYDAAIALADALIRKKGQLVTLRGFTQAAPTDPTKPWEPGAKTAVDQANVPAVFLDYAQKYIDGTQIQSGDQQVYLPALGLTAPPTVDGLILRVVGVVTELWKIMAVKPLNPAGDPIFYTLQVRQ
jgi:hypothetical protein